jgi:hypothetical protein
VRLEIHVEAVIERVQRPYSSEFGDALTGNDCPNLLAVIERVWTSTSRQLMDGVPGAETLFIS